MKKIKLLIITLGMGLVLIFIQGSVLQALLPSFLVVPNLVISLVSFLAFHEVSIFGALLALLLGMEYDLCSGVLLGPWGAGFSVVFGVLVLLSQRIFVESSVAAFFSVLFASIVGQGVYMFLISQFQPTVFYGFSLKMLFEALLSALFAPLLFFLFGKWKIFGSHSIGGKYRAKIV